MTENLNGLGLLQYQLDWYDDESRFKIVEKSRRIGFTYIQSLEDVKDAAKAKNGTDVWFSSKDKSAALEYIRYCAMWAKVLNVVCQDLGEMVIDEDKDIKVYSLEFANGKRINALSSNPDALRSKGGKIVLDEFAFHKDQHQLWKAASGSAMRNDKIRVISTYNSKGNMYYQIVQDVKLGKREGWSLHTVTLMDALDQGLLKSIGMNDTKDNRESFIKECRDMAITEDTFQQEFMCNPSDEGSAWLPYSLISPCQSAQAGKPELTGKNPCFVGMDVGRVEDLSVIVVGEMVGDVLWIRRIVRMKNMKYSDQDKVLDGIYKQFRIVTGKFDSTGLGDSYVEKAGERLGTHRVQGVKFTNASKYELAIAIKTAFEDMTIRIPADDMLLRDALNAVKQITTATGTHPKFDAERTDNGHADEFWAVALMVSASLIGYQPYEYTSISKYGDDKNMDEDYGWSGTRGIY